jgi:flagellar L-ring protein precursor FlgH
MTSIQSFIRGAWCYAAVVCVVAAWGAAASAQTSSLSARQRDEEAQRGPQAQSRTGTEVRGNQTVEKYSWTSSPPQAPRTFGVNDLVTIVVREQTRFEAEAELDTEKKYSVSSELDAFIKATAGGLGSADFRRGKPNIDYSFNNKLEGDAETKREDRLTTRITAKIIDVKPNGLLVVEAKGQIQHDEELHTITLTGTCRKEDVTPDNSVLSTQLADKSIKILTEGALKNNSTRGWIPRLVEAIKPF